MAAFRGEVARFVEVLDGVELNRPVPTCPEWDLRALVGHVGQAHRHGAGVVRGRVTGVERLPPPTEPPVLDDVAACRAWLVDGADALVAAIEHAAPGDEVWNFAFGSGPPGFWLRRMIHETAVHRYDAALTAGTPYELDPELASDGLSEFLSLATSPGAVAFRPDLAREMRGRGQTLYLHAGGDERGWLLTRGPEAVSWKQVGPVTADVTVRGDVVDLLLLTVGRVEPGDARLTVTGDTELLVHWCAHVKF